MSGQGSLQDIYTTVGGRKYQVFVGSDGGYYLYDPQHTLNTGALQTGSHRPLPGAEQMQGSGLHGLGDPLQAGIGVAATAASFVPVVGPVLGPLIGAIGSLFGGGDPTPASSIWKAIIDAREAVAQAKNAIAGSTVDTFVVPPGLVRTSDGPNGGNTGNVLASKICNEVLSIGTDDIHKVKRAQWYAALQTLQKELQQLQQQQHDASLIATLKAQIQPAATQVPATPDTSTVAAPTQAPLTTQTPYILPQAALPYGAVPPVAYSPATNFPTSPIMETPYPSAIAPTSASILPTSGMSMQQMLPYLMLGGILLVALTSSRGSEGSTKRVSR